MELHWLPWRPTLLGRWVLQCLFHTVDNIHLTTLTRHVMVGITRSKVIFHPRCCLGFLNHQQYHLGFYGPPSDPQVARETLHESPQIIFKAVLWYKICQYTRKYTSIKHLKNLPPGSRCTWYLIYHEYSTYDQKKHSNKIQKKKRITENLTHHLQAAPFWRPTLCLNEDVARRIRIHTVGVGRPYCRHPPQVSSDGDQPS